MATSTIKATQDTGWVALANKITASTNLCYYRVRNGFCTVRFRTTNFCTISGNTTTKIAQLPSAYVPSMTMTLNGTGLGNTNTVQIIVDTDGSINVWANTTITHGAALITFPVG